MLVVGLIIQITAVLLDGVDTKLGGVDGLGAQVVGLEVATDNPAAFLLGGGLSPESLDVSTLGDEVPRRVRLARVLLGLDQRRKSVKGIGDEQRDLVPESLGVRGHLAKDGFVFLDLFGPVGGGTRDSLLGLTTSSAEDLLSIMLQVEGGGGASQQSCRGGDPHCDVWLATGGIGTDNQCLAVSN